MKNHLQFRALFAFFTCILLWSVRPTYAVWKIMPIGNSITAGQGSSDGFGFRDNLLEKLAGADVQFVGPDGAPYSAFFQSGLKIEAFYPTGFGTGEKDVTASMDLYKPDIVLVHLGTNNMNSQVASPYSINNGLTFSNTSSGRLAELTKYLSQWANGKRGTFLKRIIICKIIPRKVNGVSDEKTVAFNAQIDKMFFDQPPDVATERITVTDMHSLINIYTDLSDDLHPNDQGYEKMAALFNTIIRGVIQGDSQSPGKIAWKQGNATDAQSAALEWYATGDNYNSGRANLYEMRYAQFLLTAENFSRGELISLPRPQTANTVESTVVEGLIPDQIYHFAIRAYDEMNNKGPLSENMHIQMPGAAGFEYCEDFSDPDLAAWNANACYNVVNGELHNSCSSETWNALAVYKPVSYSASASSVETSFRWAQLADAAGINATALALMLDSEDHLSANGYFLLLRNRNIYLYELLDGKPSQQLGKTILPSTAPDPVANSELKVRYFQLLGQGHTFAVFVNNQLVGQVSDRNKLQGNADRLYSGIMLLGGQNNNIDDYCVSVPPMDADSMKIYAGNNQNTQVTKKLANPLAVKVVDVNGLGVNDIQVQFSVVSGQAFLSTDSLADEFNGQIWMEAENGQLLDPMTTGKDGEASGGEYIYVPTISEYYNRGIGSYQIFIPRTDNYKIWLRVNAPNGLQNSCYIAVADNDTTDRWNFERYGVWAWYAWPATFALSEGFVNFAIKNREPGTYIDKILLTSNLGYEPTGKGSITQRFSSITDPEGVAYTNLTFGTRSGAVEVEAFVPEEVVPRGNSQVFSVYADATDPVFMDYYPSPGIRILSGNVNQPLDEDFGLVVEDGYGNRCIAIPVEFRTEYGGGTFNNGMDSIIIKTDAEGTARTRVTLGFAAETKINARLMDFPAFQPLDFYGRTENQPTRIESISGEGQQAKVRHTLPDPLVVQVFDGSDKPVLGYPVPFEVISGNGQLNNQGKMITVPTDENGLASVVYTLGDTAGTGKNIVEVDVSLQNAPLRFEFVALPDQAMKLVKVSGDNQEQGAGKIFSDSLIIKVADNYGNGIRDHDVHIRVVTGDGNFSNKTGISVTNADTTVTTDNGGVARVQYTAGRVTGTNQIIAEGIPAVTYNFAIFDQLNVLPPKPNEIRIVSGDHQNQQVGNPLPLPLRVRLLDAFGSGSQADEEVKFKIIAGGGGFSGQDSSVVNTNSQGEALAQLTLGTTAGTVVVQVTLPQYHGVNPVTFMAVAEPGPATNMKAVVQTAFSGTAGSGPYELQVQTTDVYENAKPEHPVTFVIESGSGYFEGNERIRTVSTQNFGEASVKYYLGTKVNENNLIRASSNRPGSNDPLAGSPVTFSGTALPDNPSQLVKISGDDPVQSAKIGTPLPDPFKIQVLDKYKNPVPGVSVHFSVITPDGKIGNDRESDQVTDSNGITFVYLTLGYTQGTGTDKVQVTINGFSQIPAVEFVANALAGIPDRVQSVGLTSWQGLKLSSQPILLNPRIKVTDNRNNPVQNLQIEFRVLSGGGTVDSDTAVTLLTDAAGEASVAWILGQKPTLNIAQAIASYENSALIGSPVEFRATTLAGDAQKLLRISPQSDSGIVNQSLPNPISVRVTDVLDNPIAGYKVQFKVTYPQSGSMGSFIVDGEMVREKEINTDQDGVAGIDFIPVLNLNLVQAVCKNQGGQDVANSPMTFSIQGQQTNAARLTLLSSPQVTKVVGGEVTVTVGIQDDKGEPIDGHPVLFKVTKGNGSVSSSYRNSSDGRAEITWKLGLTAGTENNWLEISAFNNNNEHLVGSPAIIKATAVPESAWPDSCLISSPDDINIGDEVPAIVSVTLKDRYGNPIPGFPGQNIHLTASIADVTIIQPTLATNSFGQTSGRIYSTRTGIVDFSAQVIGDSTFTVCCAHTRFYSNRASVLKILAGDRQTGNVGALLKEPLSVLATDEYNNSIPWVDVQFAVSAGGGFLLESGQTVYTVSTDSAGFASARLVLGREVTPNIVNARMGDIQVTFTIFARTGEPHALVKVSADSLVGFVGDTLDTPFSARVLDSDQIPVWNAAVEFNAYNRDGLILGDNPAHSDHTGLVTAGYRIGKTAGLQLVEAGIPDKTNSLLFSVQANPMPASHLVSEFNQQTGTVGRQLDNPLVVRALDRFDNGVADVAVLFRLAAGPDHTTLDMPDTLFTDSNGFVRAVVTLGEKVGQYLIQASSPGIPDQQLFFSATALSDVSYYLEKFRGSGQMMTKGRELLSPLLVRITDKFGNPKSGETVSFFPMESSGYVLNSTAATDSMGLAGCRWVIGQQTENTLWATRLGLRPNYVEFGAFGVDNAFPVFDPLPNDTLIFSIGEFCFRLNATDDDGDELIFSIPETPANASYDPGAKLYCWKPTQQQDGEWNLVFRVSDGKGGLDIDSVSVTVYTPPVISARHPVSDEPLNLRKPDDFQRFTILISYPDPGRLTYEWYVDDIPQSNDDSKFDFHSQDFPQSCYTIKAVVTDGFAADSTEWHSVCITRVQLSSFAGEAEPYLGVKLEWRTASETDNLGFNVLRCESRNGEFEIISEDLVPSCDSGIYTYTDSTAKNGVTYFYKLRDVSASGLFSDHGPIMVESKLPTQFRILQNYPNPFNPATNIRFELPVPAETNIIVYNISGQQVKTLVQQKLDPGYHQITWDGRNDQGILVSSGVYYYRLIAERFKETKKMVLLK